MPVTSTVRISQPAVHVSGETRAGGRHPASPSGESSLTALFTGIFERVAERSASTDAGFDPGTMGTSFRSRFAGLELDLASKPLDAEEIRCLEALTPDDWLDLDMATRERGGPGIAYVECTAKTLPTIRAGLSKLDALDCVSVWAADGDFVDVGALGCRTNILLISPDEPVGPEAPAAPWNPFEDDGELLATLADQFRDVQEIVQEKEFPRIKDAALVDAIRKADPQAVVRELLGCSGFDEATGSFGLNLRKLAPAHVPWVQELSVLGWFALWRASETGVTTLGWLDLHDDFELNAGLVSSLNELRSLKKVSVSVPAVGVWVGLDKLDGLERVDVRPRAGKRFELAVREGVNVRLAEGTAMEDQHRDRSCVYFRNGMGATVSKVPLTTLLAPARTPTPV